jgi:hypothetical protein
MSGRRTRTLRYGRVPLSTPIIRKSAAKIEAALKALFRHGERFLIARL